MRKALEEVCSDSLFLSFSVVVVVVVVFALFLFLFCHSSLLHGWWDGWMEEFEI